MRKFLIATHGTFATGIKSSLGIIAGTTENVFTIDGYAEGNKSIEEEIAVVLKEVDDDDELIVFSDILGGSITNQLLRSALRRNVHIISGLNLPLVLEVVLADEDSPLEEMLEKSVANAREQIVYVNKLIASKLEETNND